MLSVSLNKTFPSFLVNCGMSFIDMEFIFDAVDPGDCRLKLILFVMDFHDGFNWGFFIYLFDVTLNTLLLTGAKCNSVVRAFAHGAMGHWIDPSWWTHWAISCSSQCPTTGVTKAVVCSVLSVGWCI